MAADNDTRIADARNKTGEVLDEVKGELVDALDNLYDFATSYSTTSAVVELLDNAHEISIATSTDIETKLAGITFTAATRPDGLKTQPKQYNGHTYDAPEIADFEAKLLDIVKISDVGILKELSGVNITEGLQEALYGYQRTNDIRDLEYELEALDGKWASDGYSFPPDALVHNRSWLVARFDEKRTDRTRNIFSEIAKMAQQNVQWAYENGIKIETLHADFDIRYASAYKDFVSALVDIYRVDTENATNTFEVSIKKLITQLEADKLEIGRDEAYAKLAVEQVLGRTSAYVNTLTAAMSANANYFGHRVDASKSVAEGYKAIFAAWGGQYSAIDLKATK